jgi:protein TonB
MMSKTGAAYRAFSLAAAVLVHVLLLSRAVPRPKTGEVFAASTGNSAAAKAYSPVMKIADIREEGPRREISDAPAAAPTAETIVPEAGAARGTAHETGAEVSSGGADEFLPAYLVSRLPRFSDEELRKRIRFPPLAQQAGIEATVYLEIFVDQEGEVKNVTILKEDPAGRGFGDAAVKAFAGLKGSPALANGKATAVRYRYPVRFSLR